VEHFKNRLKQSLTSTNLVLEEILEPIDGPEGRVVDAMRYSTLGGGKRLRPFLVSETSNLFNVGRDSVYRVAAAIEMVHCYSLIHDDLPAMDNDSLRRGKPTCHIQFDEATAILAGDALLTKAFAVLSDPETHPEPEVRSRLCSLLAESIGERGMVGGQMYDILAENSNLKLSGIKRLQLLKTGMLIMAACSAGGILGGANRETMASLQIYSENLGIAFQITDDLLDVEGSEDKIGKKAGKDKAQGKATFVSILGVETAQKNAKDFVIQAVNSLKQFDEKADTLRELAMFVLNRES